MPPKVYHVCQQFVKPCLHTKHKFEKICSYECIVDTDYVLACLKGTLLKVSNHYSEKIHTYVSIKLSVTFKIRA